MKIVRTLFAVWSKPGKWTAYFRARLNARRQAHALLQSLPVRRVLVVCFGNIYRSPFVAAWLQANTRLEVRSAGFNPREGRSCDAGFVAIAREFGVDLASHRSRRVRVEDMEWADVVLIMDGHNYRLMHVHHPQALAHSLWLGAITRQTPLLIEDPYGLPQDRQRQIAGQLDTACTALLNALNTQAAAC